MSNSIKFIKIAVIIAFASLFAMTAEVAAFDQKKYDSCVALKCAGLLDSSASAKPGSPESGNLAIGYFVCTALCRSQSLGKPKPVEPPTTKPIIDPTCGRLGFRPCWGRIPPCDKPWVEHPITPKCVRRR